MTLLLDAGFTFGADAVVGRNVERNKAVGAQSRQHRDEDCSTETFSGEFADTPVGRLLVSVSVPNYAPSKIGSDLCRKCFSKNARNEE